MISAVSGGVIFSLSFCGRDISDLRSLEDFGLDNSADRLVDDFGFFDDSVSCFLGELGLGVLTLSAPISDLSETELFDFL